METNKSIKQELEEIYAIIPGKIKLAGIIIISLIGLLFLFFVGVSIRQTLQVRQLDKEKLQLEKAAIKAQDELKEIRKQIVTAEKELTQTEKKEAQINETHKNSQTNTNAALDNFNNVRRRQRSDNPSAAELCTEIEQQHNIKCR